MFTANHQQLHRRSGRGGMAPLEFVMALPILLLLMVGIVWLGYYAIGQTEVIIEARNKAWQKRFENEKQVPLAFPSEIVGAVSDHYPGDADYVTEEATTKVDVSPIFSKVPGPRSSHMILAGSWDHRAMKFDAPPDWDLIKYALVNSLTGKLQSAEAILSEMDQVLADAVAKAAAEAAARLAGAAGGGGGGGSGGGSFDDLGGAPPSNPKEGERPPGGAEDEREAKLTAERDALQQELTQVKAEIERVGEYKVNEPKSTTQEREYLEIRKARIESHVRYLNTELSK